MAMPLGIAANLEAALAPALAEAEAVEAPLAAFEEEDAVLGTSTAEQVHERWCTFLEESGRALKDGDLAWASWRQLPLEQPPSVEIGTTTSERVSEGGWTGAPAVEPSAVETALEALASSMAEARACVAAAPSVLDQLALFGETFRPQPDESTQVPGALLVEFAELLPVLARATQLLQRASALVQHLLLQLAGYHATGVGDGRRRSSLGFGRLPLRRVLDVVGELLAMAASMDGIILQNSELRAAYTNYTWIVSKTRDSGAAGASSVLSLPGPAIAGLRDQLAAAESLMRGETFQCCVREVAVAVPTQRLGDASWVADLHDQILAYCRTRLEESEALGASALNRIQLPSEALIPWILVFTLSASLWPPGKSEVRLLVDIAKMHKRSPKVVLHGCATWHLGRFLQAQLPALAKDSKAKRELDEMQSLGQRQAARMDEGDFQEEMQSLRAGVHTWLASLVAFSTTRGNDSVARTVKAAHIKVVKGLQLALRVRATVELYLVLHVCEGVPVSRTCLPAVALGLQLLKAIEAGPVLQPWGELSFLLQQYFVLRVHGEVEEALKQLRARSSTDREAASQLRVALLSLYRVAGEIVPGEVGPPKVARFDTAALAFACAGRTDLSNSWKELIRASNWRQELSRLCDTSWCYWSRRLFQVLLADLRERPRGVSGLPQLCSAFAAPLHTLVRQGAPKGDAYLAELCSAIEENVVEPLGKRVEEDLRLHAYAVMQSSLETLKQALRPELREFLALRRLKLAPRVLIDVKNRIEERLSRVFYDLTALAPNNAEAYERMRCLARERYGLSVMDGRLPTGSLDHSLDVIDVMRSVHIFAAQYSYSLHQQLFTQAENQGEAKIRTITTEHLANSIQVHGAGVISTAVNFTYGFLAKKLRVVVEFLSDESVKSRLLLDRQWMEDQSATQRVYTWTRAAETRNFIRRLGAGSDGVTFLDKLLRVVTQIGNALGYVRMLRNAGMQCAARCLPFEDWATSGCNKGCGSASAGAPDGLEGGGGFVKAAEAANSRGLIREAAQAADQAMATVRRCFTADTDYLRLLAQTFSGALGRASTAAATSGAVASSSLFHLLLPALCRSFLDELLCGQEVLAKRGLTNLGSLRGNAICFNDGFAVGGAFVLRIFGLEQNFQTLHWFQAEVIDEAVHLEPAPVQGEALFAQAQSSPTRQGLLDREMKHLAATLEAASSLFGSTELAA